MPENTARFQNRYLLALTQYLGEDAEPSLESARNLGREALDLGLDTLALARIHEAAFISLLIPSETTRPGQRQVSRASAFFAEAITPIEETHRGALESSAKLNQLISALSQQKLELVTSNEQLRAEILHRQSVEESLRASERTSSQLLAQSREMQEELRHLSRQILSVQEAERRKISRELHDVIAQTLTSINLRLATLKADASASTKDLHLKITRTQRLVEKSVEIIHRFARELRPTALDDLGLIPALETFLKSFSKENGVRVKVTAHAEIEKIDGDRRTVLYRVAQEALTNVGRHAQASLAHITLLKDGDHITMEIEDNGVGFDTTPSLGGRPPTRLGLLGMRERIEMVGGTLCINSSPGGPTTLHAEIPCATENSASTPPTPDSTASS